MNTPYIRPGSVEAVILEMTARSHRLRPASAAKDLNVSRGRLQRVINQLETQGLVITAPDPHDERQSVVRLTELGERQALRGRGVRLDDGDPFAYALCAGLEDDPEPGVPVEKALASGLRLL